MALKIRRNIVAPSIAKKVTYGGTNGKKFITIHETDNTRKGADADAHSRLQASGNSRSASWQWQVDDKEAVQSFEHTTQCWAAGDGRGDGNLNSIHIEICVNVDGDFSKAIANAIELTKIIMKDENISANNVVQHNYWSGKNCPRNLRSSAKGINWADFKRGISANSNDDKDDKKPVTPPKKGNKGDDKNIDKGVYTGGSIVMYLQSIGQPYGFSDRNRLAIKYGIKNYTGTAKQNTDLLAKLRAEDKPSKPKAPTPKPKAKAKPSTKLVVDGLWGTETTKALQRYFKTTVDGVISGQPSNRSTRNIPSAKYGKGGSQLIRAMQRHYGTTVDGQISGTSQLIRAMQRKYGTTADGYISKPSELVREIQRRLNSGTL